MKRRCLWGLAVGALIFALCGLGSITKEEEKPLPIGNCTIELVN